MTVPSVSGRNEKIGTTLVGAVLTNAAGDFSNVKAVGADLWAFVACASGSAMTSVSQSGTWKRFGFINNPNGTNRTLMAIFYRKWTGSVATSTDNDVTFSAVTSDLNSPIVVEVIRVLNGSQAYFVGAPLVKMNSGNDTSPSFAPSALTSYVPEGLALYWQAAADNTPDNWTASGTGWTQEVAGSSDPGSGLGYCLASGAQTFPGGGINTCTVPTFNTDGTSQAATTLGILIAGEDNVPISPFIYDVSPAKLSTTLADVVFSAADVSDLGFMDGDLVVAHLAANRLSVNEAIYPPANWTGRINVGDTTTAQRLTHYVATKIFATSPDASGLTFICPTDNAAHGMIGTLFRVIGANPAAPVNVAVGTATAIDVSNGTVFTTGNITTTVDNCLIMRFGGGASSAVRTFSWGDGTEITDDSTDPGGAVMTSVSVKTLAVAGLAGTATITASSGTQCLHGGQMAVASVPAQHPKQLVTPSGAVTRASRW